MTYILTGTLGTAIVTTLTIIEATRPVAKIVRLVFRIMPNYAFSELLLNLMTRTSRLFWQTPRSVWDWDIATGPLVYMALESFMYFGMVFVIEKVPTLKSKLSCAPSISKEISANEAKQVFLLLTLPPIHKLLLTS
jgi:hypothetical protein